MASHRYEGGHVEGGIMTAIPIATLSMGDLIPISPPDSRRAFSLDQEARFDDIVSSRNKPRPIQPRRPAICCKLWNCHCSGPRSASGVGLSEAPKRTYRSGRSPALHAHERIMDSARLIEPVTSVAVRRGATRGFPVGIQRELVMSHRNSMTLRALRFYRRVRNSPGGRCEPRRETRHQGKVARKVAMRFIFNPL